MLTLHPVPHITLHLRLFAAAAADLLSCLRSDVQEKHVYVATATMCFILFSSLTPSLPLHHWDNSNTTSAGLMTSSSE